MPETDAEFFGRVREVVTEGEGCEVEPADEPEEACGCGVFFLGKFGCGEGLEGCAGEGGGELGVADFLGGKWGLMGFCFGWGDEGRGGEGGVWGGGLL